jgi:hypothetical protein
MRFTAKQFWGFTLTTILVVFAHADKLFSKSTSHKQFSSKQAIFSAYSLEHGEIERVESSGGQVQMSDHRQPRPTHSVRNILNAFSGYRRVSLYALGISPVFISAGFTRMLRLLLFPHHSFD